MGESLPISDDEKPPGKSIKKEKPGLACVPCQQRKLKCDRRDPCTRCIKSGSQCTQSSWNPRQRRRRFPERDLIDRIRRYEDILRSNAIAFEPLHPSRGSNDTEKDSGRLESRRLTNEPVEGETSPKPRTFWDVVKQSTPSGDRNDDLLAADFDEDMVRTAWDGMYSGNDLLLFGSVDSNVDLLNVHPTQVNVLKLWQIYLENVDPLLKITHTPTMQTRIINATGDLSNLQPAFEALMFSIYCVALYSITDQECVTILGATRESLLPAFRAGAHQAFRRATTLRGDNMDCLTAMFLYFISVEGDSDPRSLSSALGIPLRVAQRMGIDTELNNARLKPLGAEMRRRLWWAMTAFDNRVAEQSQSKVRTLDPSWDCSVPLNIHDLDIQPGMSTMPPANERPTESIFAVTYAHLHDYIRRSASHLYFTRPALKAVADSVQYRFRTIEALECYLEESVFAYCDPNNHLHLNTILTARRVIGKTMLMEFSSRLLQNPAPPTDSECDAAISSAVTMLDSDTQLMTSPLTERFRWFATMHFPFPAYLHIIKDLRDRPLAKHVDQTWQAMSENQRAHLSRAPAEMFDDNPVLKTLMRLILQAWAIRTKALALADLGLGTTPGIVLHYQIKLARSKAAPTSQPSAMPLDLGMELPQIDDSDLFGSPADWDFTAFDYNFGTGMDSLEVDWSMQDMIPGHS